MTEQPLTDLKVVELATGIAGPYAAKLLADFGADVVKVEPPDGDPTRREGVRPERGRPDPESSPVFAHINRNKRSVIADRTAACGQRLVEGLLAAADIVVCAPEAGDPDWMTADSLRSTYPNLVVVSVTPFGLTGPYAHLPGAEIVTYAMAGPMHATGSSEREPLRLAGSLLAYQTGSTAALAALAAVRMAAQADPTPSAGRGTLIDVSAFEVQSASIDRRAALLISHQWTGRIGERVGGHVISTIPTGIYPTADGYCQIVFAPNWLPRVIEMLDDEVLNEIASTPDFRDHPDLAETMDEALHVWTLSRTGQEAMIDAQARGLAVTPVNDTQAVLADPHFRERSFWVEVDHPIMGRFEATGPQFHMSGGWLQRRPAPLLGQHQAEIETELATAADEFAAAAPPPRAALVPSTSKQRSGRRHLPLEGVRVLDLTVVWAGPLCTTLLSDLGAEVIRVDNPNLFPTATRGAVVRPVAGRESELGQLWSAYPGGRAGARPWNQPGPFVCHARNKLGATLDLRTELGRETFLSLVEKSDLLVENNSAKVLGRLGLDWPVLQARNPRFIALRLPSLGLTGPYRDFIGFGAHMEALCGLSSLRGYPDLSPTELDPTYFMDPATGVTAAFAALCALRRRDQTGAGELVEMAQAENLLNYIGEYIIDTGIDGTAHDRHGNRHPHRAPQGVYACAGDERWIVVSTVDDDEWRRLAAVLKLDIEGYETESQRQAGHDRLDVLLGRAIAGWDRDALVEACRRNRITAGPVMNEPELLADPQHAARGFFRTNASAEIPETTFAGHLWKWDGPDLRWDPINIMGADNDYVYRTVLGLNDEAIGRLDAERHLSLDYLDADGRPR